MQDKSKIIIEYKNKVDNLKKHNHFYHNLDKPKITDQEYDILKKEIFNLEKEYLFLKKLNYLSNNVGAKPLNKFKKIKHLSPMLSLSNAFNLDDMRDFLKRINNFLNLKSDLVELFCEPKIDGISATLIYEKGKLTRGLSRGDGETGEDILKNLLTINKIPKKIISKEVPNILEIRCEVYIGKEDFSKCPISLLILEMLQADL